MKKIDALTEEFKAKYERFFIGCDALEDLEFWNKEKFGEMEVFYQNELMGVILRLLVADGEIHDEETAYFNRNFGFSYSTEELSETYENCREEISSSFEERFQNGISLMRSINPKMADAYQELLGLICDIIAESDELVHPAETEEARKMKRLFE